MERLVEEWKYSSEAGKKLIVYLVTKGKGEKVSSRASSVGDPNQDKSSSNDEKQKKPPERLTLMKKHEKKFSMLIDFLSEKNIDFNAINIPKMSLLGVSL